MDHTDTSWPDEQTAEACLAVVIPCYNEESTINQLVRRVLDQPAVQEVIIVDDGSTDGTWPLLQAWPERDPRVQVFRQSTNRGKGAALQRGFLAVRAPVIIIQDADLEYDPTDYAAMLSPISADETDVVYGSRFGPGVANSTSWWHRAGNRLLTRFCNRVTGLHLSDQATCYKMFRRQALDRLDLREEGFGFCPEFTAKVARLGLRVSEVPVAYRGRTRREGKKIRLRDGVAALWCVIRHRSAGPTP